MGPENYLQNVRHSDDWKIQETFEVTGGLLGVLAHSFLPLHESFSLCHISEKRTLPVPQEDMWEFCF